MFPLSVIQLAANLLMDTTNTQNKRNSRTFGRKYIKHLALFQYHHHLSNSLNMKPALHVLLLNRSLFSNFSIDNILSEKLAEEENVKTADVNVLTKIKQEKIELLG